MAGTARRPLVAGNWKMNGLAASAAELDKIIAGRGAIWRPGRPDGLPAGDADRGVRRRRAAARALRDRRPGLPRRGRPAPITGDISAEMLEDAGATRGHRRPFRAAHRPPRDRRAGARQGAGRAGGPGLSAIVCVGETRPSARPGRRSTWSARQLDGSLPDGATAANLVVAYEPVWAIGTGLTPTPADVAEVHGFIRERLDRALRRGGRRRSASSMAARSSRQRRGTAGASPMSTARWSAAPA